MELKECSDSSELRSQFLINWISEMLTGIAKVNAGEYIWNSCVYKSLLYCCENWESGVTFRWKAQ